MFACSSEDWTDAISRRVFCVTASIHVRAAARRRDLGSGGGDRLLGQPGDVARVIDPCGRLRERGARGREADALIVQLRTGTAVLHAEGHRGGDREHRRRS